MLPRLQDQVAIPKLQEQESLGHVHLERDVDALLVDDAIEVVHPPAPIVVDLEELILELDLLFGAPALDVVVDRRRRRVDQATRPR